MPTDTPSDLRNSVLRLLDRVKQSVHEATPQEFVGSRIDDVTFTIHWRCVGRYEAIILLLKEGYTEEAAIIMRSLMNDAQRLMYLANNPDKRNATVMWLLNHMLTQAEKHAKVAAKTGQPGNQDDLLDCVRNQRVSMQQAMERFGVKKFLEPPKEGTNMARSLGRPDDEIDYLMTSNSSHGTLSFLGEQHRRHEHSSTQISLRNTDPTFLLSVSDRVITYICEGTLATASLLEWQSKPKFQTIWNEVQRELETLKQNFL